MLHNRNWLAALALMLAAASAACAPAATDNRTAPQATETTAPTQAAVLPTDSPAPVSTDTTAPASATPEALIPTTTSAADNSRTTAVAANLQTLAVTRAAETRVATVMPTLGPVNTVASSVDNSQTTAVAGMLQSVAQTRAAQTIAPTAAPTRSAAGGAIATQSVSAIATAYGPAAAAASQGVSLGTVITPPLMLRDFTLPISTGGDVAFHSLDGKYRMMFFGYLHCPDFCPLTMAEFRQVKALLGDLADEVQFIYVSVDGARDTPELIANYLDNFDPEFIGFSGDDVTLARIQPDYGFYYQRRLDTGSQAEYVIDHSTRSYLIDRAGRLRSSFTYDTEPEVIAAALRWYLENE